MSALGIYFGPRLINIVETSGTKVNKNISIPLNRMIGPDLEEKVPEDIKLISLLKDELAKNKIQAKEASIIVSGKDLIIRTFNIPLIPLGELAAAVNFEVKKYIPFKVEELISDFQVRRDKASMKNMVLFAGIKKDSLDRYFSIFKQLEIRISSMEYSPFCILRLVKLAKVSQKGIVAVLNIDVQGEDEANFVVLKDGFPLFSRDIILASEFPLDPLGPAIRDPSVMLEKLRTELRVSMDFYSRKFPTWNIEKVYYLTCDELGQELESFLKERGLSVQGLDIKRFIGTQDTQSMGFLKAYAGSLMKTIEGDLKIDLLKAKFKSTKEMAFGKGKGFPSVSLSINPLLIYIAVLICLAPYIYGFYLKSSLQKDMNLISGKRIKVTNIKGTAKYEEVKEVLANYKNKIEALNNLIDKQVFYTEVLDALPRIIPGDVWLNGIDSKILKDAKADSRGSKSKKEVKKIASDKAEIILTGSAYKADKEKALELINNFAVALRENVVFAKYFKNVSIQSIDQGIEENKELFNFIIVCRNQ